MKRLYVLRHAKAVGYTETDHERALAERGRQQVESMKNLLGDVHFDYAIVSDSERTKQTFDALGIDVPADISSRAYNASQNQLEELVRSAPADAGTVLLVAHNPGVSDLASASGMSHSLGTCDLAILEFDGQWVHFVAELAHCAELVHPDVD